MKSIAFVAHLSEISGSGVAVLETVLALKARAVEVYLLLPSEGPLADRARSEGISPVIVPNPQVAITEAGNIRKLQVAGRRIRYVLHLRRFFRDHKIGLVYINTSASIFPAVAARLSTVPIAWHIHETLDQPDSRTRWKKRMITRWADGLIYASRSAMQYLPAPETTPWIIARNSIRIADLVPLAKTRLAADTTDDRSGDAQLNVVMNGTIERKGADILLRAIQMLCQSDPAVRFKILIAGAEPRDCIFAEKLKALSLSPALADKVRFTGITDSLVPLLEAADIFVSPARNEALPIAIVEAMAAGVPVIATDVGDCADLLENGECGRLVPPEAPEALAAAIKEIIANRESSRQKAQRAFEKVNRLYGTSQFWEPLQGFLESLSRQN